ncbi:hypothetical protein PMAYCL1PPCAC_25698, partial [Pristionchus mayeri]
VQSAGKAESRVFYKEGFRWTAALTLRDSWAHYTLRCDADHNAPWKCNGHLKVTRITQDGAKKTCQIEKKPISLHELHKSITLSCLYYWNTLTDNKSDAFVIEFEVEIISAERS